MKFSCSHGCKLLTDQELVTFKKNQKRDKLKKQKCIKNNVSLIEVRPDYDFNELVKKIGKIIYNNVCKHWK